MTAPTKYQALAALKSILASVSVPNPLALNPAPTLGGVYIWPQDYSAAPAELTTPAIMLTRAAGLGATPSRIARKAGGLVWHKWHAFINVYVALGQISKMDQLAANSEIAATGWETAITARLWPNQTLNGNAHAIGEPNGDLFDLVTYAEGHLPWGNFQYWGLSFRLPIIQTYTEVMRS